MTDTTDPQPDRPSTADRTTLVEGPQTVSHNANGSIARRDRAAAGHSPRAAEAELYVLLRKAGEDRHEAQALIDRHRDEVLRRMAVEAPAPNRAGDEGQPGEARKACGCGQDGCEYCDVDDHADEEQQSETHTSWTPGPVAVARAVAATQKPAAVFGSPDCTCIPFVREGGTARYCQPGDTVDQISGWERGADCPHHRPTA